MKRVGLSLVLMMLLVSFMAGSAHAAAVGTSANDTIVSKAFTTGDTVPQNAGSFSIGYMKSSTLKDSNYKGVSVPDSIIVDTGYDISALSDDTFDTGGIGDTISFKYGITNLSNATIRVYIDSIFHPSWLGDSGPSNATNANWNISGSYKAYYDSNNDGIWQNNDTQITFIDLASGAVDTFIAVVIIPTDANNGESSAMTLRVSDRAPMVTGSTTGDKWQDSRTIAGDDSRDTQYDTTYTFVAGPAVYVTKTLTEASGSLSRPGDTLVVNITFDNDGGASALGLEIMDAVPTNTRFSRNSADSVELPYAWSFTGNAPYTYSDTAFKVYYDTDDLASDKIDFADTFTAHETEAANKRLVKLVKWNINQSVAANVGDAVGTVNSNLANTDNGRVYFKVVIR